MLRVKQFSRVRYGCKDMGRAWDSVYRCWFRICLVWRSIGKGLRQRIGREHFRYLQNPTFMITLDTQDDAS